MNRKLRRENRRRWNHHACAPNEHNAIIQERKARQRQRQLAARIRQRLGITLLPWQMAQLIPTRHLSLKPRPDNTPPRSPRGYSEQLVILDEVRQLPSKRQMVDDLVNSYLPPEDR